MQLGAAYFSRGQFDKYNYIKSKMHDTTYLFRFVAYNIERLAMQGKYLPQDEILSKEEISHSKYNADTVTAHDFMTKDEVEAIYRYNYNSDCSSYNFVLFKEGKIKQALELEKPIYEAGFNDPIFMMDYTNMLLANENYQNAKNVAEKGRKGEWGFGYDNILKMCYVKINGSDKGYQHYTDSLNNDKTAEQLEAFIQTLIVNKPAPKFSLLNLNGEKVSLDDYKGKTVVIAFWVEWMKNSSPYYMAAMNKAVNTFKSDPQTAFLFINIGSIGYTTINISAKDFIDTSHYDFNVLFDHTGPNKYNQVANSYSQNLDYQSIFIVDSKGNIRINGFGYFGNFNFTADSYAKEVISLIKEVEQDKFGDR